MSFPRGGAAQSIQGYIVILPTSPHPALSPTPSAKEDRDERKRIDGRTGSGKIVQRGSISREKDASRSTIRSDVVLGTAGARIAGVHGHVFDPNARRGLDWNLKRCHFVLAQIVQRNKGTGATWPAFRVLCKERKQRKRRRGKGHVLLGSLVSPLLELSQAVCFKCAPWVKVSEWVWGDAT